MTLPTWAYDVDQFHPTPEKEFVCTICLNILCEPLQTPCGHIFCGVCINTWLEENFVCPSCRGPLLKSDLSNIILINFKTLLMKLTLCCHNAPSGCKALFSMDDCLTHLKKCNFELVECKYQKCKKRLMRKDILHHEKKICRHRFSRCKICLARMISEELEQHDCVKEVLKRVKVRNQTIKTLRVLLKKRSLKYKALKEDNVTLKEENRALALKNDKPTGAGFRKFYIPALPATATEATATVSTATTVSSSGTPGGNLQTLDHPYSQSNPEWQPASQSTPSCSYAHARTKGSSIYTDSSMSSTSSDDEDYQIGDFTV